jgi:hypothetical protein
MMAGKAFTHVGGRSSVMPLTPDQDQDLRLIHGLGKFGELPAVMYARLRDLREHDQRRGVREPGLDVQWPTQRTLDDMAEFEADLR